MYLQLPHLTEHYSPSFFSQMSDICLLVSGHSGRHKCPDCPLMGTNLIIYFKYLSQT